MLKTQNQDAALTQAPACTPNRQTSTVPGTKRKNKHPKIPKTGSSKNDSQVCILISHRVMLQETFVVMVQLVDNGFHINLFSTYLSGFSNKLIS